MLTMRRWLNAVSAESIVAGISRRSQKILHTNGADLGLKGLFQWSMVGIA
jgi:hypothetical protein